MQRRPSTISRSRRAAVAVTTLVTATCTLAPIPAGASPLASPGSGESAVLYDKAIAEAKLLAGGKQLGGAIDYIGPNGGAEGQILVDEYKAFTAATGTKVNYTGTQDENAIIQARVQAGNPPDIADVQPGVAAQYADQGKLVNLTKVIGAKALTSEFNQSLLNDVSTKGYVYGVFQGFSNFMVWYNPKVYTGPTHPTSWAQMVSWTNKAAQGKVAPWCIAEGAGAGSGFPGAQFIEYMFIKKYGPVLEHEWGTGKLAWTSPQVTDAWKMFGAIATNAKDVSGGVAGAMSASIATGSDGLTSNPPTCMADLWGSWVPGLIGTGVQPGKNLDFFQVPGVVPKYGNVETFQSTAAVAFKDTPQTEAFMKFIESTPAQALLASANHWTVADLQVPLSTYSSSLLREAAKVYFGKGVDLVTGPNLLASAAVSAAFYKGVMTYLQNPSSLSSVLQGIQQAAQQS